MIAYSTHSTAERCPRDGRSWCAIRGGAAVEAPVSFVGLGAHEARREGGFAQSSLFTSGAAQVAPAIPPLSCEHLPGAGTSAACAHGVDYVPPVGTNHRNRRQRPGSTFEADGAVKVRTNYTEALRRGAKRPGTFTAPSLAGSQPVAAGAAGILARKGDPLAQAEESARRLDGQGPAKGRTPKQPVCLTRAQPIRHVAGSATRDGRMKSTGMVKQQDWRNDDGLSLPQLVGAFAVPALFLGRSDARDTRA